MDQNEENRVDVGEGQTVTVKLQRSVYTSGTVVVSWTTQSHQTGSRDYSPQQGSVTFNTGQHTAEIVVTIADDTDDEHLEVSTHNGETNFLRVSKSVMFIISHQYSDKTI